ncbi:larval cuticle protein 16/17-like [Rhynchophorus ferrugineus]|uniref:larval cuticle protein 16/17-like n=1 Tax=Rhynchophorus ferrugineus TaxID=354439 RepID=UPI003FCC2F57
MKTLVNCCVLVFMILLSVSQSQKHQSRIVDYQNERRDTGYYFKYVTDDRQLREETGDLLQKDGEDILSVHGTFSFISPENKQIITNYVSDENGYRAKQEIKQLYDVPVEAVSSLAGGGLPL